MAYDPRPWHDFFAMLGSASAALAGLVFVGLSIHSRAVAADPLHRTRGRNLTAGIVYVTVASGLVLIPGQSSRALGWELLLGGLIVSSLFAELFVQHRARLTADLRIRTTVAIAASLLSAVSGISLIVRSGGGLYVLVAAGLAAVVANVFGAWSLLLGLARD